MEYACANNDLSGVLDIDNFDDLRGLDQIHSGSRHSLGRVDQSLMGQALSLIHIYDMSMRSFLSVSLDLTTFSRLVTADVAISAIRDILKLIDGNGAGNETVSH